MISWRKSVSVSHQKKINKPRYTINYSCRRLFKMDRPKIWSSFLEWLNYTQQSNQQVIWKSKLATIATCRFVKDGAHHSCYCLFISFNCVSHSVGPYWGVDIKFSFISKQSLGTGLNALNSTRSIAPNAWKIYEPVMGNHIIHSNLIWQYPFAIFAFYRC